MLFRSDGYGDPDNATNLCEPEDGYTTDNTDCDDTTDDAWPGNVEVCDEIDNDCDGDTDEGGTSTCYADKDDDEFGDPSSTEEACSLPTGYTDQAGDSDDEVDTTTPDAHEVGDEADTDCDGGTDEDPALDAANRDFDDDVAGSRGGA